MMIMRQSMTFFSVLLVAAVGSVMLSGCQHSDPSTTPVATKTESKPTTSPAMLARRSVKATTDADASKINKSVKDISVEDLVANKSNGELSRRQAPFETSVWRVKAKVESIELKKDGDYYMVLRGEKGGQTVVEVPDPKTVKGSPFEGEITATRKALEDKFHPTSEKKDVNEEATITGVGFLGFSNKPSKGSKGFSGARLMPGTDVKFGKS